MGDYSAMAQQAASAYFGGGGVGAASAAGGGGGNSSSLKASQDSTYSFNNNADFTVGSNKSSNTALYVMGGIAVLGLLAFIIKK